MKSKASQPNNLVRIISTPVRALSKARDFYVKSMNRYADRVSYGHVAAAQITGLPKSFSARSHREQDVPELVRASSGRAASQRPGVPPVRNDAGRGRRSMPPRSSSVAMGRIDEERPCCYFGEDDDVDNTITVRRNRSKRLARAL